MSAELLGKKMGMTQIFDVEGNQIGVTVLEVGPCVVLQKKTVEKDGYHGYQLGFGERKLKHATNALVGHCKNAKAPPAAFIREFRSDGSDEFAVGDKVTVKEFQAGQYIDVLGISKGKGFQGVVRRHGFAGGKDSHGASGFHRRPGAIGQRTTPGHVYKNRPMPGHMGHRRVTTQNLRVVQVRETENLMLVEGSVPGPRGELVVVRQAKMKSKPTRKDPK